MCDQLIRANVTVCHQDRVGQGHSQSNCVAQDMHSTLLIYQNNHLIIMVSDTDKEDSARARGVKLWSK